MFARLFSWLASRRDRKAIRRLVSVHRQLTDARMEAMERENERLRALLDGAS